MRLHLRRVVGRISVVVSCQCRSRATADLSLPRNAKILVSIRQVESASEVRARRAHQHDILLQSINQHETDGLSYSRRCSCRCCCLCCAKFTGESPLAMGRMGAGLGLVKAAHIAVASEASAGAAENPVGHSPTHADCVLQNPLVVGVPERTVVQVGCALAGRLPLAPLALRGWP